MNTVIRRGLAVLAATALLTGAAGLAAAPASASTGSAGTTTPASPPATQYVQFSSDGIHWSDSYTGSLFGGVLLIPGGSATRALYVRNGAPDPGRLTVTLFDVTTTDVALAGALSLTTSTPGFPGSAVPFTSARPCATLTQGQVLASGDSIRLDNLIQLADLNGTAGQGKTAAFKIAVTLNSTDLSAPAPNTCPADLDTGGGTVIGIPDPGTTGTTGSTTATVYHLGRTGWTSTGSGSTADPEGGASGTVRNPLERTLVANTERLYQEDFVAYWLAMAALGALLLLIVRRRRRDDDGSSHHTTQYPPTQQIGTGR